MWEIDSRFASGLPPGWAPTDLNATAGSTRTSCRLLIAPKGITQTSPAPEAEAIPPLADREWDQGGGGQAPATERPVYTSTGLAGTLSGRTVVELFRKGLAVLGLPNHLLLLSLLLSSLELRDTKVYEPQIRALLGTASHFCQVVVLKLRTVPIGTALNLRISFLPTVLVDSICTKRLQPMRF